MMESPICVTVYFQILHYIYTYNSFIPTCVYGELARRPPLLVSIVSEQGGM